MRRLRLLLALPFPLLTTYCHYEVTSPRLWAHNSSAAFDAFVALWLLDGIFIAGVIWHIVTEWRKKEKAGG